MKSFVGVWFLLLDVLRFWNVSWKLGRIVWSWSWVRVVRSWINLRISFVGCRIVIWFFSGLIRSWRISCIY